MVADVFETKIYSEYEPQYWGYSSKEQWHEALNRISKEHDEEYYNDLINFLQGKPHMLKVGTNGMKWALTAQQLVAEDASWLLADSKEKLLEKIKEIDRSENTVTLSPLEVEAVRRS